MFAEFLSVDFTTPQTNPLRIACRFNERPLWVALVAFSAKLPKFEHLSIGATFDWSWGDREIITDIFVGMPQDERVYNITLQVFQR